MAYFGSRMPARLDLPGRGGGARDRTGSLWRSVYERRYQIGLAVTIALGTYLRIRGLGVEGFHADESSSWTPILSITKTGLPGYPSGVLYTRAPLYHYLTAAFVGLFGTSRFAGRMPSVVFGVLAIPLVYRLAKEALASRAAGLAAALLLALSPWAIFTSRSLRFYQQFQFFGLLTTYLFVKGFILDLNRKYQVLAFIAFTCTFLSQEVGVTLFPAFFLAYLFTVPRSPWKAKRGLIAGCVIVGAVAVSDAVVFILKCLTPPVAITATNVPVVKPHLANVTDLALTLMVGYNRMHVILTFFLLVGLAIALARRDRICLVLYGLVAITTGAVTVAVMQVGLRYIAEIYPLYILLATMSVFSIKRRISKHHAGGIFGRKPANAVASIVLTSALITAILGLEPLRVLRSYSSLINRGDTSAYEFVRDHMQEEDIVIAGHHPGAAANTIGKCDYYLLQWGLYDEIFEKNGKLIDRRGAATLVDNVDKLRTVFESNKRAWIVITDMRMEAYRPEVTHFIRSNARLVYQPFLCNVFLWEQSDGVFMARRHRGQHRFYFD
jgi:hypothetical protein